MMVAIKVDAKVQGTADQEKYPIIAKVKGTGKDGSLSVQVSGNGSAPISARISGDKDSPVAVAPVTVTPISVIPDLTKVSEYVDLKGLFSSLNKLTEGLKIDINNGEGNPIAITLGKIPVDLTISVSSPTQEQVFRVDIRGSIGEK